MRNDQGVPGVSRRVRQTGGVKRCRVLSSGPGAFEVQYPSGNDDANLFGVTLDDAADGRGVTLQTDNQAEIEAGGSFGASVDLVVGAEGVVIAATPTDAHVTVGRSVEASTGAGDRVMVDIRRLGAEIAATV